MTARDKLRLGLVAGVFAVVYALRGDWHVTLLCVTVIAYEYGYSVEIARLRRRNTELLTTLHSERDSHGGRLQ